MGLWKCASQVQECQSGCLIEWGGGVAMLERNTAEPLSGGEFLPSVQQQLCGSAHYPAQFTRGQEGNEETTPPKVVAGNPTIPSL